MSKLWFMPATPVLSNDGTTRGLPISRAAAAEACRLLPGIHYVRSSSRAPGSISGRSIKSRVNLLQQPSCLHNPGCGFMFVAEAWDRPELTTCCRHLDIEGAIALRR
jgi:hypothetical protein